MDYRIIKYPRTPHIEGSRLQIGDEDLSQVPFSEIKDKHIVIEEKIDGANTALSFDGDGNLLLQSRGHYLTGGFRERHYNLFKQWAGVHRDAFYKRLSERYIMYGEWMYAKHSIYYDALPDYFMEFDVLDRETGEFLDTKRRHEILSGLPVSHVPVLSEGRFQRMEDVLKFLGNSRFITENHIENLRTAAEREGQDAEKVLRETDMSMTMEGLYIKAEEDGEVKSRVKFVRASFLQTVAESQSHWLNRPIIPNGITRSIDELFLPGEHE
ncbi:MAG: RNA ligase family protein [Clostridia bacterium]|nr:RNA ligase family protein [Clostridia bacterium]